MSTCYRFTGNFSKKRVLKAMDKIGLFVADSADSTKTSFCITDGSSYLWAYNSEDEKYVDFCRYGGNYTVEDDILTPLADQLQTDFLSEYDEDFYSDEEMSESDDNTEEEVEEKPKKVKKAKKKTKKSKKKGKKS